MGGMLLRETGKGSYCKDIVWLELHKCVPKFLSCSNNNYLILIIKMTT